MNKVVQLIKNLPALHWPMRILSALKWRENHVKGAENEPCVTETQEEEETAADHEDFLYNFHNEVKIYIYMFSVETD